MGCRAYADLENKRNAHANALAELQSKRAAHDSELARLGDEVQQLNARAAELEQAARQARVAHDDAAKRLHSLRYPTTYPRASFTASLLPLSCFHPLSAW